MLSTTTYVVKATTATPKPGKRLLNIARREKTGCLRQASLFAQGSRYIGGVGGGFAIYQKGVSDDRDNEQKELYMDVN